MQNKLTIHCVFQWTTRKGPIKLLCKTDPNKLSVKQIRYAHNFMKNLPKNGKRCKWCEKKLKKIQQKEKSEHFWMDLAITGIWKGD